MRTKAATILLFGVLLITVTSVSGQDAAFSQFYANPVYLNPALAGNRICPRVTLNYRNQYPSIGDHYLTYSACFDMYSTTLSGGIAVQANADMTGPLASYSGSVAYSYHLNLSKKLTLNAALQAGYFQYRLNWEKLVFEDMIVPGTGQILPSTSESQPSQMNVGDVDFGTGVVLGYDERFYLGAAVNHITSPDLSFYAGSISRLDPKVTIHAGALFNLREGTIPGKENDNFSISPNIVYMQQGNFHQLNGGMYLNMYPFVTGLWLRHNFENPDALIALVGFQQPTFKVGYSFDFTLSKLGLPAGGAHELSFVWFLPCPKKEFKHKAIKCPSF